MFKSQINYLISKQAELVSLYHFPKRKEDVRRIVLSNFYKRCPRVIEGLRIINWLLHDQ